MIGDQDNQVGEAPAEEREAPQDNHQDHQQEAAGPAHAHPQDHDYSRRDGHHHGDDNREPENREDRAEENEEDAQHNQSIDELIRQLQQEQDARILAEGGEPPPAPPPPPAPDIAARNNRSRSLEGQWSDCVCVNKQSLGSFCRFFLSSAYFSSGGVVLYAISFGLFWGWIFFSICKLHYS